MQSRVAAARTDAAFPCHAWGDAQALTIAPGCPLSSSHSEVVVRPPTAILKDDGSSCTTCAYAGTSWSTNTICEFGRQMTFCARLESRSGCGHGTIFAPPFE
jgi:hypothetical protein